MQAGSRIFTDRDAGGWRQFLDGRPLHAGDGIEVLIGGHWIRGRYESEVQNRRGMFYTRQFDPDGREDTAIPIVALTVMRFRWPALHDEDTVDARLARAIRQVQTTRQALRDIRAAAERGMTIEGYDDEPRGYDDMRYWNADESPDEAAKRRYWILADIKGEADYGLGY